MDQVYLEQLGDFYQNVLRKIHTQWQPKNYFEIGTLNGDTLKLSKCKSVSVDPNFNVSQNVLGSKPTCVFYQYESDVFFSQENLSAILGEPLEFAFLDGLHLFEYLLRDFINTEKHCARTGLIVMHDCIPGDPFVAVRDASDPSRQKSKFPGYWTGDVWKIIPVLKKYRPDLRITILDANPTGLVLVTDLEPTSRALENNYDAIMEEFLTLELESYGLQRLHDEAEIRTANDFKVEDVGLLSKSLAEDVIYEAHVSSETFSYSSTENIVRDERARFVMGGAEARDFLKTPPLFHDDPDGARVFYEFNAQTISLPSAPIIETENVKLVGYRTYLTKEGKFFLDETPADEAAYLNRLEGDTAFENEDTGLRRVGGAGRRYELEPAERSIRTLTGKMLSLCSHEPSNYGSFLFRTLPKLTSFKDAASFDGVLTPVYTPSMRGMLILAGVDAEKIIEHDTRTIYDIKNVVIPAMRNPHAIMDDESLVFYEGLRNRYGSRNKSRKIFVSRMGWTGSAQATQRVMLNEEELAGRMAACGFEVVSPEKLSALEQIETFSSAEIVVGSAGSAMFNVVFCHPGTRVIDIESEPHWIFAHTNLFSSCKLSYGIFEGIVQGGARKAHHQPFSVNIDALIARIEKL